MKKIFSGIILILFSFLIILPLGVGFFVLHFHHTSHHNSLCIEHCIENLGISQETGIIQVIQEVVGKTLILLPFSFLFVAWIYLYFIALWNKYSLWVYKNNNYLLGVGSIKSRT
ncbi:hypothetical protein LAT59_04435 [Candidatus Gracilibacteria bacterium]|nr:hypothetical protein [Candidatus Gracilibacteria bacterium]